MFLLYTLYYVHIISNYTYNEINEFTIITMVNSTSILKEGSFKFARIIQTLDQNLVGGNKMNNFLKVFLSTVAGLSICLLPVTNASAEQNKPVDSVSQSTAYQKMRDSGMSESDIQSVKKHNESELSYIQSGKIAEKILRDKREIASSNQKQKNALSYSRLGSTGDIFVAYNASSWGIDFGYPGHAAIVSNNNTWTIEAFPDDGVQYHLNDWKERTHIYAMSVRGATPTKNSGAATYAANQVGKEYNYYFFDPWTEDAFYCSQLVWKAWKSQGIDVDYVTIDPIITPMEIAKSGNTIIYYEN